MSIVIHHLEHSRSTRILWMLEELELAYTIKHYRRHPKTMRADPALREVHPLGRSPLISVDGRVLAESGAILEYFAEREHALRPSDPDRLVDYRYWLHYGEGSAMPPLLVKLIFGKLRTGVPFFLKPLTGAIANQVDAAFTDGEIRNHFGWVERWLGDNEHFAGDFSMADIQMLYPIEASLTRGGLAERPNTTAWLARMRSRPALQKALAAGGELIPPGA